MSTLGSASANLSAAIGSSLASSCAGIAGLAAAGSGAAAAVFASVVGLGAAWDAGGELPARASSRWASGLLLARTHHDLPSTIKVRGRLGGEAFEREHKLVREGGVLDKVVPRLWAGAFVERLLGDTRGVEAVRGKILSLGLEYGMMTPFTSFLSLDSESAFAQQGIIRRHRNFGGVKLTADSQWTRGAEPKPTGFIAMLGAAASRPGGPESG